MKSLLEHNRKMFIEIEEWLVKNDEQRKKDAEIRCHKCGEKMQHDGELKHRVGPFYNINVICPKLSCGATGVKIVKALAPLDKIRKILSRIH